MTALFILGAPGAGKTALARDLLGERLELIKKPKWTIGRCIAAGHYTGETFDGADTVPYNGVAAALDYWEHFLAPSGALTIFDGDRFSYTKALARIERICPVRAVFLVASPELLAERRRARGSKQNATWMLGRETKAVKFASRFEHLTILDASRPVDELVAGLS